MVDTNSTLDPRGTHYSCNCDACEPDLDECADCGGSTAVGTPDPHVCGPTVLDLELACERAAEALTEARLDGEPGAVITRLRAAYDAAFEALEERYEAEGTATEAPCEACDGSGCLEVDVADGRGEHRTVTVRCDRCQDGGGEVDAADEDDGGELDVDVEVEWEVAL